MVGRDARQTRRERYRVDKDSSSHVTCIWRQTAVASSVNILRQSRLAPLAGNIVGNSGSVDTESKPGNKFLPDWLEAWVNMVQVDRGRVARLILPKFGNRPSKQSQHA